jgi:hypothetical protein
MSRLVVPSLILSAALVATIGWEFQTAVQPEDAMAVGLRWSPFPGQESG